MKELRQSLKELTELLRNHEINQYEQLAKVGERLLLIETTLKIKETRNVQENSIQRN